MDQHTEMGDRMRKMREKKYNRRKTGESANYRPQN
jgi:hypothetical protein